MSIGIKDIMRMKNYYLPLLLTMLMSMVGAGASARGFSVANSDGVTIYYNYNSDSTSVYVTSNSYSGKVTIPEAVTYNGKKFSITSIGNYAFSGCSGLTSVIIPNSVTSIGIQAFYGCRGLTSVIIPNSVTSIGDYAFDDTDWYNSQSDGLVYINNVLYRYKGTMPVNSSVTIKEGTTRIGSYAFSGCSGLTSVAIPNSVTSIGIQAFSDCSGLTSVIIPNSVTKIGEGAFNGCDSLTEIVLDQNNKTFWCKDGVLYKNDTLVAFPFGKEWDYVVPDNVTDIIVLTSGYPKCKSLVFNDTLLYIYRPQYQQVIQSLGWRSLEYVVMKNAVQCHYPITDDPMTSYEAFKGLIVPPECCELVRTILIGKDRLCQVLPLYPADITFYHKVSAEEYANALKGKDKASITSVALYGGMDSTLTVADIKSGMNPNCLYYIKDNTATEDLQDNVIQLSDLTANNIKLVDGYSFNCPGYFQARKAQYTHTPSLWANGTQGWETICLPYDASVFKASKSGFVSPIVANSYGNFWLREFVGASSKALFFAPTQNGVVEAGKPYIIAFPGNSMGSGSLQGETISFIGRDVEFNADSAPRVQRNNYIFVGNYDNVQDEGDGLILNSTGASFVSSSAVGNKPFTAYFKTEDESAYAKSMAICLNGIEEEETAIDNVLSGKAEITAIGNGTVVISSAQSGTAVIRSINGATMRNVTINAGDNHISGLPRGLYIINNQKILVE